MEDFIDIYGIESPELEQLDGIVPDVFSTNETRRKIIPPPPPADPLQDQSMDIPLENDDSYEMIAFGDRSAWINDGNPQLPAYIAGGMQERQRMSVIVKISEKSRLDAMRLAMPRRMQMEMLDVTGSTPSRVVLLGSTADGDASEIQVAPFENELPLPLAVSAFADAGHFQWSPYGTCLEGQCRIWQDGRGDYDQDFSRLAFVIDLSLLFNEYISPLVRDSRALAIRIRYSSSLSETGWPAWRAWSEMVRFSVNTPPPVPYDLSMEGAKINA